MKSYKRNPNCSCGGTGELLYQATEDSEVTVEPCLCVDPKTPISPPQGRSLEEIANDVGKRWEAAGRGPWIAERLMFWV